MFENRFGDSLFALISEDQRSLLADVVTGCPASVPAEARSMRGQRPGSLNIQIRMVACISDSMVG